MKSIVVVALFVVVLAIALVADVIQQQPHPVRGPQPANGQLLPFKTIYLSGGTTVGDLIINDNTAWLRVYAEVICGYGNDCVPAVSVNFTSSSVLAVLAGWRPSGGYRVEITQVTENSTHILVQTLYTSPGSSCVVDEGVTDRLTSSRYQRPISR